MKKERELKLMGCVIEKNDLLKFLELCNKYVNSDLKIKFKDETLSGITCDELKKNEFTNLKIEEITLIGSLFESEKQNHIYFSTGYDDAYTLSFESDNDIEFLKMRDDFEKWVASLKKRESVAKVVYSWITPVTSFVISIILMLWTMVILNTKYNCSMDLAALVIFPFIAVTFGFLSLLRYAFPKTEIDLGINNHKKLRGFLWFFITVIAIPIVLSFIK